jgi:glycosyltransferase involved in cell wall biosynthesis
MIPGTSRRSRPRIAVVGTVGVPANYGGFETLVENLTLHAAKHGLPCDVEVYCTATAYPSRPKRHNAARLLYLPIKANGVWSVPYDILSLLWASWRRSDAILVLGVSGAIALPIVKLLSRAKLVVNIDGLEWKRAKWAPAPAAFLRWCEKVAVRFGDVIVADNQGIVDHVSQSYGRDAVDIAYGGDHASAASTLPAADMVGGDYALMLCRIEPENNVEMILEAFADVPGRRLVAVGNWTNSDHGRQLHKRFSNMPNITLSDPIYEAGALYRVRSGCSQYIHGHSAGGTNPSLVEMMSLGTPVLAFDCVYNRYTTEGKAAYFTDKKDLAQLLAEPVRSACGAEMAEIAMRRYTWDEIGRRYFELLLD